MPLRSPPSAVTKDRVIEALDRAVLAAERGAFDSELPELAPSEVAAVSASDIRPRLDQVLLAEHPGEGLDALLATGLLRTLFPEVTAMVGFGDGEWRHKDVWRHTKQVVAQAAPRVEVRWAALFHDIGKVKTRSVSPDGEVHFFGHAEVGARMFDRLERRMRLFTRDNSLRSTIRFLILHHLRASQYDGSWTDSAVRRFAREIGGELDNLLCLSRADITTKRAEKRRRGVGLINELSARISALAAEDAQVPPLPTGLGNALMEQLGIGPSRLIGDIKRTLEVVIAEGQLEPQRDSAYYVEYVLAHRDRLGLP